MVASEKYRHLGSMPTKDWKCKMEIKTQNSMDKEAFSNKKKLMRRTLLFGFEIETARDKQL